MSGPRGEIVSPSPWDALQPAPARTIPAADIADVLFDQLDYLVEHTKTGICGCDICRRYWAVKAILMEPFEE